MNEADCVIAELLAFATGMVLAVLALEWWLFDVVWGAP
jgi:hypothetical protein